MARIATTLGQVALTILGVHLAADRLDDGLLAACTAAQGWLDAHLAGPLGSAATAVGLDYDALLLWDRLQLAPVAAWSAFAVEVAAVCLLCASFLLTPRRPTLSWRAWRSGLSVHALVLPLALSGVLLAGGWSLTMATEDLLPSSVVATVAAGVLGLVAVLRFGLPAWGRAVAALERSGKPVRDLAVTLVIGPIGLLAWVHGVPLWGLMP